MYSDAGTVYVRSIKYLIREMQRYKQDIFASSSCYIERQWSKRDAFEIIGCNYEEYQNAFQCEATFVLIKKTAFSIEFVKEWLMYCCDRRIVTDDENVLGKPNAVDFISNRHDQTAFSLLCKKHNIKAFRGISDSSELYKFLQYKDGDFFGMTRQQLIENALRHRASDEYARGSYKRIIVNTRLQNTTKWLFCKRLVKKIIINLRTDMRKKSIEGVFLDIKIL